MSPINIPSPDTWEPITFIMCGIVIDIIGVLLLVADVVMSIRHMALGAVDVQASRYSTILDMGELIPIIGRTYSSLRKRMGPGSIKPFEADAEDRKVLDELQEFQDKIHARGDVVREETLATINKSRHRAVLVVTAVLIILFGLSMQVYGLAIS